jgi:outer membrane lipoprotein-sorting protein
LGGPETWGKISSMRFKGNILIGSESYKLLCYQRKPDLLKMILKGKSAEIELGYDGKEAWQYQPGFDIPASAMSPEEARRFIHSAIFGNYLIYPFHEGKTIDYLGTVRESGTVCHHIRVSLQNEYRVDYYIDIRNYLDTKVVNFDEKSGHATTLICEDFRSINGFPIAFKVTSIQENGETSMLELDQVDFNIGLTDWIFKRPR